MLVQCILKIIDGLRVHHLLWKHVPFVHHAIAEEKLCHIQSWPLLANFHLMPSHAVSIGIQLEELVLSYTFFCT